MTAIPHSRPTIVPGIEEAVARVVASGQHAGGAERQALESALAERVGVSDGVAVQSGFAALHIALLALGVESGHRVVVPSYVCASLLHALAAVRAEPIVADIDPRTFNLNAATVLAAIQREVGDPTMIRAVIAPHMMGVPVDTDGWRLTAPVIEDCAMALGSRVAGIDGPRDVGAWGECSTFSFYATKMLSSGQGGMVLTANRALAEDARDRQRYDNREAWRPCWNYPLPDLAASVARAQLPFLDDFLLRRRQLAARYDDAFDALGIERQQAPAGTEPNHFRYVILASDAASRDHLQNALAEAQIEAKRPVFRPLHEYLQLEDEHYPGTASVQARALSLPIYPALTDADQDRVIAAVTAALQTS
ncbi:MAG: DegT/DnrJ/EryC1/StrS family aminotransferase [Planctomycetota bacterium]